MLKIKVVEKYDSDEQFSC